MNIKKEWADYGKDFECWQNTCLKCFIFCLRATETNGTEKKFFISTLSLHTNVFFNCHGPFIFLELMFVVKCSKNQHPVDWVSCCVYVIFVCIRTGRWSCGSMSPAVGCRAGISMSLKKHRALRMTRRRWLQHGSSCNTRKTWRCVLIPSYILILSRSGAYLSTVSVVLLFCSPITQCTQHRGAGHSWTTVQ